jgi:peptidoglycan-N-acetylglucosamine deacetylase
MTRASRPPLLAAAVTVVLTAMAACGPTPPLAIAAPATAPVTAPRVATQALADRASVGASPGAAPGRTLPAGPGAAPAVSGGEEHTLPGNARVVALTFDDGPDPRWTPQALALLHAARAHATFCLIGRQVAEHPRLVARIVAEGHQLCNHTFDHDERLAGRPVPVIDHDIQAATAAIEQAVPGAPVSLFRAPGGSFTGGLDRLLVTRGLRPLGWSVDPDDWRRPGTAVIVARVLAQIRPGSIILLHDGGGDRAQTLAALQQLLPALAARGYRIVQP